MKHYLSSLGFDVWSAIKNGYTTPTTPPVYKTIMRLNDNNSKDMGTILNSLEDSTFVKVMHCTSTKHMWDKLQRMYEGDDKAKKEKLQTHRGKFETLKMNEEESIASYFLREDEIVNTIRGLGKGVKETIIVKKVLRSLPSRFNPNIFSIEEINNLDNLTMDELHGILSAYEMRIE
jgi:hypothetical protein